VKPTLRERNRALQAFALTVAIAMVMRWDAGDLMWGIWAASTAFGYVYGLVIIVKNPEEVDAGDGTDKGRLFVILAFFTIMFGIFHYGLGMFLDMLFPITSLEGWAIFFAPVKAFGWYWGVIATTFYSRWPLLKTATKPSDRKDRIFDLFINVGQMMALIFLLMFLTSFGLMRLAVYPILVLYFLPPAILHEKLKWLLDKWDDYLNRIPPDEFEELDEIDDS
jgi:hypothetical protein